ncbi:MAG: 2-polyprenylphenol 6-hydroxylase [Paracoccaceae bacterium]
MRGPHNLFGLIRTGATLDRTGALPVLLEAMQAPRPLRIAARILARPFRWLGHAGDPSLPPLPRAIQAMGPAYIKFGQVLSTRPDVVGDDLAGQLRVLQDALPPFTVAEAKQAIQADLGVDVDDVFVSFSDPVAAASIAQVHKAVLADSGETVAVKVLRPGIEKAFRKDVDAFHFIANFVQMFAPGARRLRPVEVVTHFEGTVMGELDLRLEAASASQFEANTARDKGFTLPQVKWALSGRRVMTMEWAEGVALGDNDGLDAAGHNRVDLSERVLQLFLSHALRDGFFHADMHQGNLKIAANGDIIAYDFGIMGHIDEYTRRVYAQILFGFIRRDYRRVAEVHFEAGYVPADRDVDAFARALRAVGEPIFGMDSTYISMGRLLNYLFEVTERFGMQTRTELILLQRTMVVVEGVARSLDPNMNIWKLAQPVVEEYIQKSIGPQAVAGDLMRTGQVLARFGPRLPALVEAALIQQAEPPAPDPTPWGKWAGIACAGGIVGLVIGLMI